MIYFTSDHHFNHKNVIKHCKRPFKDVEEMNSVLIERWNSKVGKNDIVYHLGDFTLSGKVIASSVFSQLNGNIWVVGNFKHHDKNWINKIENMTLTHLNTIYKSASGYTVRVIDPITTVYVQNVNKSVVICHYPIEEWERKHYGVIHLHGHSHGNSRKIENRYDVGVDCWDFYPVTLEEILNGG